VAHALAFGFDHGTAGFIESFDRNDDLPIVVRDQSNPVRGKRPNAGADRCSDVAGQRQVVLDGCRRLLRSPNDRTGVFGRRRGWCRHRHILGDWFTSDPRARLFDRTVGRCGGRRLMARHVGDDLRLGLGRPETGTDHTQRPDWQAAHARQDKKNSQASETPVGITRRRARPSGARTGPGCSTDLPECGEPARGGRQSAVPSPRRRRKTRPSGQRATPGGHGRR